MQFCPEDGGNIYLQNTFQHSLNTQELDQHQQVYNTIIIHYSTLLKHAVY
jgi:hypothetical protein